MDAGEEQTNCPTAADTGEDLASTIAQPTEMRSVGRSSNCLVLSLLARGTKLEKDEEDEDELQIIPRQITSPPHDPWGNPGPRERFGPLFAQAMREHSAGNTQTALATLGQAWKEIENYESIQSVRCTLNM